MKFVFIMESYVYATLMYYFSFFLWYFVTFSGELVLNFLYSYIFFSRFHVTRKQWYIKYKISLEAWLLLLFEKILFLWWNFRKMNYIAIYTYNKYAW